MNIYISNLDARMKSNQLRELFETFGRVESAHIIVDPITRRCKGFGFVEMKFENEATLAIRKLNGVSINGKMLNVKIANVKW